jgi:hypothetical protein
VLPGLSADALTFPTTIYEKWAERRGTLDGEQPARIVRFHRFHNFLKGFRIFVRIAIGSGHRAQCISAIDFMLNVVATERPRIGTLQQLKVAPPAIGGRRR